MANVIENVKRLDNLKAICNNHLIGGKVSETATHLIKLFHDTYCGLGGVRVAIVGSKADAYEIMIKKLDGLYNEEHSMFSAFMPLNSLA